MDISTQPYQKKRVPLKTIFREKELWLLILLGIFYFYRPLFLGESFFFRDLYTHFIPQRRLLADFAKMGKLPLWDNYLQGGQPYMQHLSNSVFYPSSFLYVFIPFLRALNIEIVLHVVLSLVFTYLLARVLRFSPISSCIVALVYGFCGCSLSVINMLNLFWALSYMPLLLMFWHLFLSEGRQKWFVIAVIIGVIQVFASSPETTIMSLLVLLGWTLSYPFSRVLRFRGSIHWMLLGIFMAGIASVQIIPAIELLLQSKRAIGLNYSRFTQWSLHPKHLLEMLFPQLLGHVDTLPWDLYYWGGQLVSDWNPYFLSIYFGCVVIALGIIGGLHRQHNSFLPFRVRMFLFSLFVFSLVLSLGRFLPLFHFLYQYIPGIKMFRYPIKFLIAGMLPLALLAGYASEILFGDSSSVSRSSSSTSAKWPSSAKILLVCWGISVILITLTITFLLSDNFANRLQEFVFNQSDGEIMRRGVTSSLTHALGIWLLVTLLYQYHWLKKRKWQHYALACILAIDLLHAGKQVNSSVPEEVFTNEPPIVQIVRDTIGNGGRLFRTKDTSEIILQVPPDNIYKIPHNHLIWGYRWNLAMLNGHLAVFYKIPVIFHDDVVGLANKYIMSLKSLIDSLPWERKLPLLSAAGVTSIITEESIAIPQIHRITELPNWSNTRFYLYRNKTAAARVEFVTSWERVNSDDEALGVMLNPNYDPRVHVVLQKPESAIFDVYVKTPKSQEAASNFSECDDHAQINKIALNTHAALFSVSNNCDGYLVFAEPFYPGWKVYVDGSSTPILRANYAFSAVFLKAGDHKVERRYRPNSLLYGVFSSLVFCGLLCLMICKGWLLGKRVPD